MMLNDIYKQVGELSGAGNYVGARQAYLLLRNLSNGQYHYSTDLVTIEQIANQRSYQVNLPH